MNVIRSSDNPRVRRWRRLAASARLRRAEQRALIEGAHLVEACLDAGVAPQALILSETGQGRAEVAALRDRHGGTVVLLSDALFAVVADAETPVGIAAEIALPGSAPDLRNSAACIFLEAVQDAGNVGAILRSAAAFGVRDVVLGAGCADAWSPKALRAGMGAHFALRLAHGADLRAALARFGGALACTVVRGGRPLDQADLRGRIGWIFGSEGQGVSAALAARAGLRLTIPMGGHAESLNVAAAAAICLYERARQLRTPAAPA